MPDFVLAIDAGTTSVRALIFDANWNIAGHAQLSLALNAPLPGHVEQSPDELWNNTLTVVEGALKEAKLQASAVAALGITSQRASCMVWEKESGIPLTPIFSWQDMRGVRRAEELTALGFPQFPAAAACKLEAAVDSIPDGRARMVRGELCWGNVDSYLAYKLSGGTLHATDLSQACATGYFDFETQQWDQALIDLQGLDPSMFPTLVDTSGELGTCDPVVFGAPIPINAIVGDQQSAAIAQDCTKLGDLKITFGTSGTCNLHTESEIVVIPGTYPLVLQRQGDRTDYCVEAMIITAGATLDWLGATLNIPHLPESLDDYLCNTSESAGALLLPALQGLGSPSMHPERTAQIDGLTLSTTPQHIVYAALEGIVFRTRDILEHIADSAELPDIKSIRVDGGLTRSDTFVRILADALQKPVLVCQHAEATALGVARLVRQALNSPPSDSESESTSGATFIQPDAHQKDRYDTLYNKWRKHFGLSDESC